MCRNTHKPPLIKLYEWYRNAFAHAALLPPHHTKAERSKWVKQYVRASRAKWESKCDCDECQVDKVLEVLS